MVKRSVRQASVLVLVAASLCAGTPAQASVPGFARCADLHQFYPYGVGKPGAFDRVRGSSSPVLGFHVSRKIYRANSGLDRDRDGIACESH